MYIFEVNFLVVLELFLFDGILFDLRMWGFMFFILFVCIVFFLMVVIILVESCNFFF